MSRLHTKVMVSLLAAIGAAAMGVSCDKGSKGPSVEQYLDFQDMSSRELYVRVLRPLREEYGKDVRFIVRSFPSPIHPRSKRATVGLECAREREKAREYADALLSYIAYSDDELVKAARQAGLETVGFQSCLNDPGSTRDVDKNLAEYAKMGVMNSPTVVIGAQRIPGSQPKEIYEREIRQALGRPVQELKTYPVRVVRDPGCETCRHDQYVRGLKENFYPNLVPEEIDCASPEGRSLLQAAQAKAVPLFVFGKEIEAVSSFAQIRPILGEIPNGYFVQPDLYPFALRMLETPHLSGLPTKGSKTAGVKVVEFLDFHCGHCAQFSKNQLPVLLKKYVETGKASWAVGVYPLSAEHEITAQAAACAEKQGKFWEYHDKLFQTFKSKFPEEELVQIAGELRLKADAFKACLNDPAVRAEVKKVATMAREAGVNSTPSFFVGDLRLRGGRSVEAFEEAIEQKLKEKGKACTAS